MGTKVQIDSYMPGHCSMRDLSRESNGASWPSYYGDNNLPNGQFYYGFLSRTTSDPHPGYDKDVVKQTMLEHEAIFKNQVFELHRLYQVQRDLMDEVRRKEQIKRRIPYETSSSSSPVPSQMQHEHMQRWNGPTLPLANSAIERPIPGTGIVQSSPHSSKGKSIQAGPSSYQNCCSPKNSEVSESRPTKSRRKMLDLQLPADEYIDTDEVEQFGDAKVSDNMTPSPDKNGKFVYANGKPFLNYPGKTECHGDASRSDSHVTKSRALADLNEPLHVEETTAVSSVKFLGAAPSHSDVQYMDHPTKLLGSAKDVPQSSRHGSLNGSNSPFENGSNGRDWFCYALESEQHKSNVRSINKGTPPTSSQPMRSLLDQLTQPPAFLTCDRVKEDPWRAKSGGNSLPSYNVPEPIRSSLVSNQPSLFHSSDLGKTWDQCASSWSKPNGFLSQKLPVSTSPFLNSAALSRSPQLSAQSNDLFGNKWNLNSSPGANAARGAKQSMRNGFYQGSSASFKELPGRFPQVGFDYGNCNYSDKSVPCSSISYVKPATCTNVSPVKDMNLNVPFANGVSNDHTILPDVKIVDTHQKLEDPLAVLPWLRGNGSCSKEAENPKKGLNKLEAVLSRGPSFASSSYDDNVKAKKPESNDCPSNRKILGVPIFEKPPTPKKENLEVISSSAIHQQSGKEEADCSWRKGGFDMNLPCEPSDSELDTMNVEVVVIEKRKNESASLRNHFDLNSCVAEEESPCGTSLKRDTGIDLEAPVMVESEEDVLPDEDSLTKVPEEQQPELPPDKADDGEAELAKSAAELIVAISSSVNQNQSEITEATCLLPVEASEEEMLLWFVDIACSSGNDPESHLIPDQRDKNGDQGHLLEGLDDYEAMILRLKECNVEEYFPKPSIPEIPNLEENGQCVLMTRTRKGHGRRGRQRRDFQRDILPGLASLSRHEVTEDLQTFGGLMRATGHPWHSGPNRRNATRNGCARGRRRSLAVASAPVNTGFAPVKQQLQQLSSSNTEVVLEDRCLTGWGKTTRRPRRQRYPAGNPPPPVPLS